MQKSSASLSRSAVLMDSSSLLRKANGEFRLAARQLRDTLRARRPAEALLVIPADTPVDHAAGRLRQLAALLGVTVLDAPRERVFSIQHAFIRAQGVSTAVHLIADDPASRVWLYDSRVIWHGPDGAERRQPGLQDEAQWRQAALISTNPWIGFRQAEAWLAKYGDVRRVLGSAEELGGAPGRRFRQGLQKLTRLVDEFDRLKHSPISLPSTAWSQPKGAARAAEIRHGYEALGLTGWLEPGGEGPDVIVEPSDLEGYMVSLAEAQGVGLKALFSRQGGLRQVQVVSLPGGASRTIDLERSVLADVMEERLAAWLGNRPPHLNVISASLKSMMPWLLRHGLDASVISTDAEAFERVLRTQDLGIRSPDEEPESWVEAAVRNEREISGWGDSTARWISRVERPLQGLLCRMQTAGVPVNHSALKDLYADADRASSAGDQKAKDLKTYFLNGVMRAAKGDRVHPVFDPFSGRNHRVGTSEPNLQNLPKHEWGQRLRRCFTAGAPDKSLLLIDYKQAETAVLAALSKDPALCAVLAQGGDVHSATAAKVFSCSIHSVTDEQRRVAKAINFGLVYGMSSFGLAKKLDITEAQAGQYIAAYFQRHQGVESYLNRCKGLAQEKGYVETLHGRRIHIPGAASSDPVIRSRALRQATNSPMQGSIGEAVKRAMLATSQHLDSVAADARLLTQVHDELIFEVPSAELDRYAHVLGQIMMSSAPKGVVLRVSCKGGPTLAEDDLRSLVSPRLPGRTVSDTPGRAPAATLEME